MAPEKSAAAAASAGARTRGLREPAAPSVWAVEKRLANVEPEMRVQFTRIAQLQAELDLLSAALRDSVGGVHKPGQSG
jgi:hypothetical protein